MTNGERGIQVSKTIDGAKVSSTIDEAAQRLGVTKSAVYAAIRRQRIPAVWQQGKLRVRAQDVERYAESRGPRGRPPKGGQKR